MPMPKRKPNYNPTSTMQELLTAVCEYYGDPVDDRKEEDMENPFIPAIGSISFTSTCGVTFILCARRSCIRRCGSRRRDEK